MHELSENLDARDLWELWERSVPLEQAFYRFGPRAESERYIHLKNTSPPAGISGFAAALQETQGNLLAALAEAGRKTREQQEAERLERRLQKICTQRLQRTALFGIGFSTPRKADDAPYFVPLDTWGQFIGWHNGKVSSGSLKMEAVRIGRMNWMEEYNHPDQKRADGLEPSPNVIGSKSEDSENSGNYLPTRTENPASPPKREKPGRKSRKPEILAAHTRLTEKGLINPETPVEILGHLIREHILDGIEVAERNTSGLSDETIRRVIREATQNTI